MFRRSAHVADNLKGELIMASSAAPVNRSLLAILALALWLCLGAPLAQAGPLQAGAARVSITPAADEFPYPYESGRSCEPEFAPGKPCNFVGVHDPLYARALMLGDGEHSVLLVLVEVTNIPDAAELKRDIAHAVGLSEVNVLLAATHTHEALLVKFHGGSPNAAEQREIERVKAGALAAARSARDGLRNARIAFGRGSGWINVNNGDHLGAMGYDPSGPSDKSLDVLRIEGMDHRPIALLVNYASHAEVMYRSVTRDGGYEVTADIPGAVSTALELLPAGAPVVLFSAGAEGDQMSLFKSLQGTMGIMPARDEGAAGWSLLDVMARRLTASVLEVLEHMPAGTAQARIAAAATAVSCPGQHITQDEKSGQSETVATGPVSIPLNVMMINDIALVGVGGDVGSEIGMAVKRASPLQDTTLISMTAGSVGYVLADSSYARPSHGVLGSPLQPHCAEGAIVSGATQLLKSLQSIR